MECDLSSVLNAISSLSNQLVATETLLSTENQEIKNEITIDITSNVNTDYKCDILTESQSDDTSNNSDDTSNNSDDTSNNSDDTSNNSDDNMFKEISISGKGLLGLHENLKTINSNLDSIFATVCQERTPGDVVTVVASDKVLGKAQGKFLKLHLVTFDNYPKRNRNSTYWQVQIPEAKEIYDWNKDFRDLVWQRGNLYAEMYFENIQDPVSGYFLNKNSANSWFDSILPLTNGVERNRKYHEQLSPNRNISQIITRPYRAFIASINPAGRSICHLKFVPPKEADE